ncbi:MAG TPA: hypothetical protein VH561_11935 [Micromonosporaceae bacterium]|jgi:hypothetical protein
MAIPESTQPSPASDAPRVRRHWRLQLLMVGLIVVLLAGATYEVDTAGITPDGQIVMLFVVHGIGGSGA